MKAADIGLWVSGVALAWVGWMFLDMSTPQPSRPDTSAALAVIQTSDAPVLVEFYADWCGACRSVAPTVDELAREMAGQVRVIKFDVDVEPNVAAQYGVRVLPTFIVFKKGQEAARQSGAIPKIAMHQMLGF